MKSKRKLLFLSVLFLQMSFCILSLDFQYLEDIETAVPEDMLWSFDIPFATLNGFNKLQTLSTILLTFYWFLLISAFCLLLLPLWESVIVLCFVVRYFMSILVLQLS